MKRQIRRGVFETNSSSVHSLTMCAGDKFDEWTKGKLIWDKWSEELVSITPEIQESLDAGEAVYLTYDQFNDWDYIEFETFKQGYTTSSGDQIVAFGYYGEDR